jgi:Protein of unknown function (DUF2934)
MGGISDDAIRERAYLIWEREGRPYGREYDHWVMAQVELAAEGRTNGSQAAKPRARGAAPKAKAAAAKTATAARKPPKSGGARTTKTRAKPPV